MLKKEAQVWKHKPDPKNRFTAMDAVMGWTPLFLVVVSYVFAVACFIGFCLGGL